MGRHSGAAEADIQRFEALLAQEPAEGSRRAARRAERLAQQQQVTESVVDDASSVTTGTDATQEAATDAQAAASNDESASAADAAGWAGAPQPVSSMVRARAQKKIRFRIPFSPFGWYY